jgi:hypothetical protein
LGAIEANSGPIYTNSGAIEANFVTVEATSDAIKANQGAISNDNSSSGDIEATISACVSGDKTTTGMQFTKSSSASGI